MFLKVDKLMYIELGMYNLPCTNASSNKYLVIILNYFEVGYRRGRVISRIVGKCLKYIYLLKARSSNITEFHIMNLFEENNLIPSFYIGYIDIKSIL